MYRHTWTEKEDELCCEVYIDEFIENHSAKSSYHAIGTLMERMPHLRNNPSSIQKKLRTIKTLVKEYGIYDSSRFDALENYSSQCKQCFIRVMVNKGLSFMIKK